MRAIDFWEIQGEIVKRVSDIHKMDINEMERYARIEEVINLRDKIRDMANG